MFVFVVRQFIVLTMIARRVPPRFRVRPFFFGRFSTLRSLIVAALVAGVLTLLAELLVRFILNPAIRAWLSPHSDHSNGLFRLSASERVIAATPARRKQGLFWPAGTLVRTNLGVWFIPNAWDVEPWPFPQDQVSPIRLSTSRLRLFGLLEGFPDDLVVPVENHLDEVFAVPDPEETFTWFMGSLKPASTSSSTY